MVKLRIWNLAVVGAVLALLTQEVSASDPNPTQKTECSKECDARAKAAFAFAKLKAEAAATKVSPTAPMPKPVDSKKVGKSCVCGDDCRCAAGDCPSKCPVTAVAVVAEAVKAKPPPAFAPKRIVGYTCGIDQYGRRVCVPVYEP